MKSPADVERAARARHLLRAILRECTYLPDSWTRQWTKQHVVTRFRTYQWKAWKKPRTDSFGDRLREKEKDARGLLALLRRANEGERDRLLRVMLMAYGRVGKRRHELMLPLLSMQGEGDTRADVKAIAVVDAFLSDGEVGNVSRDDPKLDTTTQELASMADADPTTEGNDVKPKKESRQLEFPPQLRSLLISQIKTAPSALTRPNPRRLQPTIADFNSWHRPMPQKRIKNLRKKHSDQLRERVLPPLPQEEWYRLRDLASGSLRMEEIPKRRTPLGHLLGLSGPQTDNCALRMVVQYGKAPKKVFEQHDGHAITPRFMRRLYAEVFSQCPLMELKPDNTEWVVRWGERELNAMKHSSGSNGTHS